MINSDVEVKVSIVRFLNNLLGGLSDATQRMSIRYELMAISLDDVFNPLLEASLVKDLEMLKGKESVKFQNLYFHENRVKSSSTEEKSGVNPRATMSLNPMGSKNAKDPLKGTMSGECIASKNRSETTSKLANMLGSKQTKRRWYTIDPVNGFCWYENNLAPAPDTNPKGTILINNLLEIRAFTNDTSLMKSTEFCFEVLIFIFKAFYINHLINLITIYSYISG